MQNKLTMAKMTPEEANELLPEPRLNKANPLSLVYLAIAPPKWGKTTTFCDFPDALLIAFERGYQFQTIPTIFIDDWDIKGFTPYQDDDGVNHFTMKLLEKVLMATDKHRFLIFDTADMAAKKCSDYHCRQNGWAHAQDGGDFGKGYDIAQNTPFRQLVNSMLATGRGVAFLTHSEIKTAKLAGKDKAKRETTLPGGIHKFLHSQADIIMHGSFGVRQKGKKYRDRIVQTEGDAETLAGTRTRDLNLPPRYIVNPESPWKQWSEFFTDPTAAERATAELFASPAHKTVDAPEEGEAVEEAEQSEAPVPKKKRKAADTEQE